MSTLKSLALSAGFALLQKGLSLVLRSNVLSKIKAGVIVLMNDNSTGEQKKEAVKHMARQAQAVATEGKKTLNEDLLEVAVRIVYLAVTGKELETTKE